MSVPSCISCGAEAVAMISTVVRGSVHARPYCDPCWRVARSGAGPLMLEGAIHWGDSWTEMEEWLTRCLQSVATRSDPASWRLLLAAELHRQAPHLPTPIPRAIREFLGEFGEAAG